MKLKVYIKIGRKYEILDWDGEELTIGINTPPVKGGANTKLIEILSDQLSISKSKITVIKGHASRHKVLKIDIDTELFNNLITKFPKITLPSIVD